MNSDMIADVIVGLSAAASLWFLVAYCWRPPSITKTIVKTASVLGLAVAAFLIGGPVLLVVALALGALGDFCLSRTGQAAFLAGLIAFAAAHLAYIALLASVGGALQLTWPVLLLVVLAVAMGALLFRHAGALRWPVVVYVGIIAVMGVMALGLPAPLWLALAAALCFVLSDAVLGLEMFVLSADHAARRITPFVIWLFYWAAQFLFLVSLGPYWMA